MTDRNPPQDIEAEQAVLGAALIAQSAFLEARATLAADDWYRPAHVSIWAAMVHLADAGVSPDAITVGAELARRDQIGKCGGLPYLHTLVSSVPTSVNVGHWAALVVEKAVLRRLVEAGVRIQQIGYGADESVMAGAVDDAVESARHELATVPRADYGDQLGTDVLDLLEEELPLNWVIPGLLSEGERLLLTAGEGLGKSTLLRQILVTAAAGLDPFTQRLIEPVRCMGFDYENGRRMSQDRYGPLVRQAAREGAEIQRGMLTLEIRPRGVNLMNPGQAAKVLRAVERHKPQLVMIGPVYRLHEGDPNDERDARKITVVLDQIREISGAAVITEHHMAKGTHAGGKRSTSPVGSGLWLRWPEYGYGLVLEEGADLDNRKVIVEPWRGAREERHWPEALASSTLTGRPWPWAATYRMPASGEPSRDFVAPAW